MRVGHYLLYLASCMQDGMPKKYAGITGVLEGQSDDAAKLVRRSFHIKWQKAWLKGMDASTMSVQTIKTQLSLRDALVEEARLTASLYLQQGGHQQVRGGPWCRCRLPWSDKEEIANVDGCTSRQAVRALAARSPSGSLALHLAGKSYSKARLVVGKAAASTLDMVALSGSSLAHPPRVIASRPPLVVCAPKRQSGKSKTSGGSGKSGHEYRLQQNISYSHARYKSLKWGVLPRSTKNKAQRTFRAKKRAAASRAARRS